jgi:hypothetical protein
VLKSMENTTKWTLVLLAILAILLAVLLQPGEPVSAPASPTAPAPTLTLSPDPLHENESAELRLLLPPSCAYSDGQLSMDGQAVPGAMVDGSTVLVSLRLVAGSHTFSFDNGPCRALLSMKVLPALCPDGTNRSCTNARACAGQQACKGGIWLSCRAPAPVCAPHVQVPCPLDSCTWGLATCNSCGSGWSKCR